MKSAVAFFATLCAGISTFGVEGTSLRAKVAEALAEGCSYPSGGSVVLADSICIYNHGVYAINQYSLYQSESCQYYFPAGTYCVDLSTITTSSCFQPGSTFTVWVNAAAARCSYRTENQFTYLYYSNSVSISLGGTVDSITSSVSTTAATAPSNAYVMMNTMNLQCCTENQQMCTNGASSCGPEYAACVTCQTDAGWTNIGSGTSVSLQESLSWSDSESQTNSVTTTNSVSASLGVQYKGLSASASYTHSLAQTTSNTFTDTKTGTVTVSNSIPCTDGTAYQWEIQVTQSFPGVPSMTTSMLTSNYVCVPSSIPNTPQCPALYCDNDTASGANAGCQCCNSDSWTTSTQGASLVCKSS